MKLFSKTTYAQTNELLKTDTPFSNTCKPVTIQEVERRILRDRETAFVLSQEEEVNEVTSVPLAPTLNNMSSNATNQGNMAETSSI